MLAATIVSLLARRNGDGRRAPIKERTFKALTRQLPMKTGSDGDLWDITNGSFRRFPNLAKELVTEDLDIHR